MDQSSQPGLVQCELTGQWLPEEETVTLHGRRVGAEGKLLLLERVRSGRMLPGEVEAAGVGSRIVAVVIDLMLLPVTVLLWLVLSKLLRELYAPKDFSNWPSTLESILIFGASAVTCLLYLVLTHAFRGQTVGKMLARIKVVRCDRNPVRVRDSMFRVCVLQGPWLLLMATLLLHDLFNSSALLNMNGVLLLIGLFSIPASLAVMLLDRDQRRGYHDRIAGTRVIRVHRDPLGDS